MSTEHASQWEIPRLHLFPVRANHCSGNGSAAPSRDHPTRGASLSSGRAPSTLSRRCWRWPNSPGKWSPVSSSSRVESWVWSGMWINTSTDGEEEAEWVEEQLPASCSHGWEGTGVSGKPGAVSGSAQPVPHPEKLPAPSSRERPRPGRGMG